MSGHGHHDADADLHSAHDDHHDDETTSDDFPADEPRSPGWLPLLGGGLLLAAVLLCMVFGSDENADTAAGSPEAPAAAAPAPSANRPAAAGRAMPSQRDLPAGHPVLPQHP
jgi:hypothetical protein